MPNKHKELTEQLQEDYEHAFFRLAVHKAALQEGEALLAEKEELRKSGASGPSPAALQKFEQQLDAKLRPPRPHLLGSMRRKIAVAVVVSCCIFLTAMTTVQAFRTRVLSLWTDLQPQTATFQLRESEAAIDGLAINWTQAFVPTFIPAGYVKHHIEITRLRKEITYVHGESQIKYMELRDSKNLTVNREDSSHIETVDINGVPGILVVGEEVVTVVWARDEHMFVVQGQITMDTALAIARGVEYVE